MLARIPCRTSSCTISCIPEVKARSPSGGHSNFVHHLTLRLRRHNSRHPPPQKKNQCCTYLFIHICSGRVVAKRQTTQPGRLSTFPPPLHLNSLLFGFVCSPFSVVFFIYFFLVDLCPIDTIIAPNQE